ncbi:NAD(P)-dependent oxidoreductase [Rhodococcus kronopolitis]|uniref:NAD(P)-dependent oxidoreductase n=1 Tax=Rhodococcus kronopolitis TaxID=1460226 RepID=A0ABV9FQ16_9NOCA
MSRIIIFGAGGRAGRRVVGEAVDRGHLVTAVVRDLDRARHSGLAGVTVLSGDVTSSDSVAELAAGHDAAISVAARLDVPSTEFFADAARALVDGLGRARTGRLVTLGIGSMLETAPGVRVLDDPAFPAPAREFSLGHVAELEVLRTAGAGLDWVMLAPPPTMLDETAERTGRYRIGGTAVLGNEDGAAAFSYADLAVALVDEAVRPGRRGELVAVG